MNTTLDLNTVWGMVRMNPFFGFMLAALIFGGLLWWASRSPLARIATEISGTFLVLLAVNRFIAFAAYGMQAGVLRDHVLKLVDTPMMQTWGLAAIAFTCVAVLDEDIPGMAAVTGVLASAACIVFAMLPGL